MEIGTSQSTNPSILFICKKKNKMSEKSFIEDFTMTCEKKNECGCVVDHVYHRDGSVEYKQKHCCEKCQNDPKLECWEMLYQWLNKKKS